MIVETHLITFAASAQQFPAPAASNSGTGLVRRVYSQPLRGNTHVCYQGTSAVTNDASGAGVAKDFAAPATTTALDSFDDMDNGGLNRIDPTAWWGHGTSGEKLKVTYEIG